MDRTEAVKAIRERRAEIQRLNDEISEIASKFIDEHSDIKVGDTVLYRHGKGKRKALVLSIGVDDSLDLKWMRVVGQPIKKNGSLGDRTRLWEAEKLSDSN